MNLHVIDLAQLLYKKGYQLNTPDFLQQENSHRAQTDRQKEFRRSLCSRTEERPEVIEFCLVHFGKACSTQPDSQCVSVRGKPGISRKSCQSFPIRSRMISSDGS